MKISLAFVILLLSGCATLGLNTPKSFDQSLAEAYGVHTAVVSATATAVTTGSLSSADGIAVNKMALDCRSILDMARDAELRGDTSTATAKLALATSALASLQQYLNSKGGKP